MCIGEKMPEYVIVKRDFAVLGIIIILIVALYFYFQPSATRPVAPAAGEMQPANASSYQPQQLTGSLPVCNAFTRAGNEISCEDAILIVAKKYNGELYNVSKDGSWMISIKAGNEIIAVEINKTSGKILQEII